MCLSISRGMSVGAEGKLCSTCICSFMPYGSGTWSLKQGDMIWHEINYPRMDRWIYNIWSEEKISAEEHGNRLE